MSQDQTAEDIRAQHIEVMGTSLGVLYTALRNEVLWLHVVWRQYRVLFGTSAARIELENKAAGAFFVMLNDTLWDSVLLHICRLTDPPVVGRRSNKQTLTLLRLAGSIQEPELAKRMKMLVGRAKTAAKFARDWRDRRIAHRDLALVLSEGAQPLASASRASVEDVLAKFRDIIRELESRFLNTETSFDYVSPPGDAEALLYQLRLARMILDERHTRMATGQLREDDFRQPPQV